MIGQQEIEEFLEYLVESNAFQYLCPPVAAEEVGEVVLQWVEQLPPLFDV